LFSVKTILPLPPQANSTRLGRGDRLAGGEERLLPGGAVQAARNVGKTTARWPYGYKHGLEANGLTYTLAAKRVATQGYTVLVVHYFDRTGTRGTELAALRERLKARLHGSGETVHAADDEERFRAWKDTVLDAVGHARTLPGVDGRRVGLVGCSLGAYLALAAAAEKPGEVAAVIELFGGLPRPLRKGLRKLPPVLIVHGAKDRVVPLAEAHALRDLLAARKLPFEVLLLPDSGHMFRTEDGRLRWQDACRAERQALAFLRAHFAAARRTGPGAVAPSVAGR
jgi:dienelactone hydrolase